MNIPITINSKIALSAASIMAAATLVFGATFAFFSDVETSSGNIFSAGTLDLVLCDDNENTETLCAEQEEGPGDSVTATFGALNMAPGDCTDPATLNIRNNGSVPGNHVDISITNSNDDMDDYLQIDTLTYDTVDQLGDITDSQPNTFDDLQDFESDPLVDLALTDTGVNHPLVMVVCLDESAPDSLQGASNTMNMTVLLNQGAHSSEI